MWLLCQLHSSVANITKFGKILPSLGNIITGCGKPSSEDTSVFDIS